MCALEGLSLDCANMCVAAPRRAYGIGFCVLLLTECVSLRVQVCWGAGWGLILVLCVCLFLKYSLCTIFYAGFRCTTQLFTSLQFFFFVVILSLAIFPILHVFVAYLFYFIFSFLFF